MASFDFNFFAGRPEFSNQTHFLILADLKIVVFQYYDEISTLLSGCFIFYFRHLFLKILMVFIKFKIIK